MGAHAGNAAPVDLARRILELNASVDREVHAAKYENAARLRDEREALERKLKETGNETLIRNIEIAVHRRLRIGPATEMLEPKEFPSDQTLLRTLASAPLPVRWVINGFQRELPGTLRQRLKAESLESKYYQARLPVISSTTLARATYFDEWLQGLADERGRNGVATIWICTDLFWLNTAGALALLLALLRNASFEFVACAGPDDAVIARRILRLPGVSEIQTQQKGSA